MEHGHETKRNLFFLVSLQLTGIRKKSDRFHQSLSLSAVVLTSIRMQELVTVNIFGFLDKNCPPKE